MSDNPESKFVAQYGHPAAKRVARDLYRAMHPTGMHTNGITIVRVEASHLQLLLQRWQLLPELVDDESVPSAGENDAGT